MATATEKKEAQGKRIPMITSAKVGWKKEDLTEMCLGDKKATHDLFHIVGTITGHESKESKTYEGKESIEFRGSFLAINFETGERFTSSRLYLPGPAEADIAGAVARKGIADIVCTITVGYNDKSSTSYAYGVTWHGEEDTTGFDSLLEKIPGVKSLPAPKGGKKR